MNIRADIVISFEDDEVWDFLGFQEGIAAITKISSLKIFNLRARIILLTAWLKTIGARDVHEKTKS